MLVKQNYVFNNAVGLVLEINFLQIFNVKCDISKKFVKFKANIFYFIHFRFYFKCANPVCEPLSCRNICQQKLKSKRISRVTIRKYFLIPNGEGTKNDGKGWGGGGKTLSLFQTGVGVKSTPLAALCNFCFDWIPNIYVIKKPMHLKFETQ